MKKFVVISGNFTAGGNFSGYEQKDNERIHFYKRQMETLGWKKDADVKFPFFCSAKEKDFQFMDESTNEPKVDENGNPVLEKRLTAGAVWKTRQEMVETLAQADERLIYGAVDKRVAEIASEEGLSIETMKELATASETL